MAKIIKIKDCTDCPISEVNKYTGKLYCLYKYASELPESGIHKDCKLEDYKKVKK